jgi:trimeric autotransporter adhesin
MRNIVLKLVISGLFFSALAWSQTFQGSLRGRIVDPAGAVIEGAKLTLISESTQVRRTTATNNQGEFVFAAVTPATYTVIVETTGFKHLERRDVTVSTQANVTLDLVLEIGRISEEVTVTEETPRLQLADASIGQLLDNQKIVDLPNLGRNIYLTARLAETVVWTGGEQSIRMHDHYSTSQVSIAGGPVRRNNFLVDGISFADLTNRILILPSPETTQDLKVQANTYDAEVGRTGGGTYNVSLRSGENRPHGSFVFYDRETAWAANRFENNRNRTAKPNTDERTYAGSFGGPVYIPKIYNGHNRTFFFFSTEQYKKGNSGSVADLVPTALERAGNFSQTFNANGTLHVIYDPLTTRIDPGTGKVVRDPFPNNIIPTERISALGQQLVNIYPKENATRRGYNNSSTPNYVGLAGTPHHGKQYTIKLDHQFAPWLKAAASYVYQRTQENHTYPWNKAPDLLTRIATRGSSTERSVDATSANAQITPNASTVIAIRWGFNRLWDLSYPAKSQGYDITKLGFPRDLAQQLTRPAFPSLTVAGYTAFGGGNTSDAVYYTRNFNASISKFFGRHSLKSGFDFRVLGISGILGGGQLNLGFSTLFTNADPYNTNDAATGSGLASLLLGYPDNGNFTLSNRVIDSVKYYGFFLQDDFRVTPRLTLNFGLRLEHETGVREDHNNIYVGLDREAINPISSAVSSALGRPVQGVLQFAGQNGNPTRTSNPHGIKPGPRFGFAYALNKKTVVRGGYGIFWAPWSLETATMAPAGTTAVTSVSAEGAIKGLPNGVTTLANPYPDGLIQPEAKSQRAAWGQNINILDPKTQSGGYVQQYSFDVQREAFGGLAITAGIIGARSLHLTQDNRNINQLDPSYFSLGSAVLDRQVSNPFYGIVARSSSLGQRNIPYYQLLLPYPQYLRVNLSASDTASSRYFAFYVRGQKQFRNGLALLASYTWSRNYDNIVGLGWVYGNRQVNSTSAGPQNAYAAADEWSRSTQDLPHRFTTSISYELPLGHGKRWANSSKALDWAVGGWSLNIVGSAQSGYPLEVIQTNRNNTTGYQRAAVVAGVRLTTSGSPSQRYDGWINPSAFTTVPAYTYSNGKRTYADLRTQGKVNFDVSLFKTVKLHERVKAQFRAEFFNFTNTPIFSQPNVDRSSVNFGKITGTTNNPRQIQLGARISF